MKFGKDLYLLFHLYEDEHHSTDDHSVFVPSCECQMLMDVKIVTEMLLEPPGLSMGRILSEEILFTQPSLKVTHLVLALISYYMVKEQIINYIMFFTLD